MCRFWEFGIFVIQGISFNQCGAGEAWLCHIGSISDDLKNCIRRNLASICHGDYASQSGLSSHEYKSTLSEFLVRYRTKAESTKKGMIGEMLTQLILREYFPKFLVASPYFNQEERSIRKGFDLVIYEETEEEVWITEVKSGQRNSTQLASDKSNQLISDARNDLYSRLNSTNSTLWYNAISSARSALDDNSAKNAIISALDEINSGVSDNTFSSFDSNVFLVAVVYGDTTSTITPDCVSHKYTSLQNGDFSNVIVMAIQKEAYSQVASFLESESR